MMADCEAVKTSISPEDWGRNTIPLETLGANFWSDRQSGSLSNTFHPLTLTIGNDGLIYAEPTPMTPHLTPTWREYVRLNWPLLLLWNEARGLLTLWAAWPIILPHLH